MATSNFVKDNFVLILGIALPALLMAGFLVMASVPQALTDPPKYDLIFTENDYQPSNHITVGLELFVKNGVLTARYTPNTKGTTTSYWKKIYRYDAAQKKVHPLTFLVPANADKMTEPREEAVAATAGLTLDTSTEAPDGYSLSQGYYGRTGIFGDLFMGSSSYSNEARLKKGAASVRLLSDGGSPFGSDAQFLGWVAPKH
jgi:hypothetical protein